MRITRLDQVHIVTSGSMRTIAYFDVELSPEIKLYGMRLLEAPSGKRISYAPSSGGRRFATFAPDLAASITDAAIKSYERQATANDINRH